MLATFWPSGVLVKLVLVEQRFAHSHLLPTILQWTRTTCLQSRNGTWQTRVWTRNQSARVVVRLASSQLRQQQIINSAGTLSELFASSVPNACRSTMKSRSNRCHPVPCRCRSCRLCVRRCVELFPPSASWLTMILWSPALDSSLRERVWAPTGSHENCTNMAPASS